MDDFQGVDLLYQEDGRVMRVTPIRYEERQRHAKYLAQKLRSEGNNEVEAYAAVKACSMVAYRPMLTDEELKAIVKPIFAAPLSFSGLGRNRRVLELVKDFIKRGMDDDEISRRMQFFNSRCCTPALADEELKRFIRMGQSKNLSKERG
jgi:hypothetical protein